MGFIKTPAADLELTFIRVLLTITLPRSLATLLLLVSHKMKGDAKKMNKE